MTAPASDYSAEHADAFAAVRDAGTSMPVTHVTAGAYSPTTDTVTGSTSAVLSGVGVKVPGDPTIYAAHSLIPMVAPSIFWVPETYGVLPSVGDTALWRGVTMLVKSVLPLAPNGVAIAATVILVTP